MGSTWWAIAGGTHSDITTLYPKHFNQSHSGTHIMEGCIAASVNYDSYWILPINRLNKEDLFQSSAALQK